MAKQTTIEIAKQSQHFSSAHFTIFSATSRERLHGHNFRVAVSITGDVDENGLCFDYAIYKKVLKSLCAKYDEYTLIAEKSPHLKITSDETFYYVEHNNVVMPLLITDTILLPILNITIEELSHYLLTQMLGDFTLVNDLNINAFEIRVSSGPDQWGVANWERD